jgi:hypothetical protein
MAADFYAYPQTMFMTAWIRVSSGSVSSASRRLNRNAATPLAILQHKRAYGLIGSYGVCCVRAKGDFRSQILIS